MNGDVVAIVPIRSLSQGKTRLAVVLSPEARAALIRSMARGVLESALASGAVAHVLVVSPDPEALTFAASFGPAVTPVLQHEQMAGLNAALAQGMELAQEQGAAAVLVLFGDLPLLTPGDIRNLLRRDAPIVIAPDRHGSGTNALLLRLAALPPGGPRFVFRFGRESYARHVEEAHHLGLEVATAITAGTACDLDTPEDLASVMASPAARAALAGAELTAPHGAAPCARGAGAW
jgi:2-phospho-L-lactate guanylyltransferase